MGFVLTQRLRLTPQTATAAPIRQATVAQQFKVIAKKNKFRPKKKGESHRRHVGATYEPLPPPPPEYTVVGDQKAQSS
ncbi:hypothetical protein WJX73_007545 [Symbiochloris irregularis]|uniref:Uncharacterized protein n=1 Tax=Symbiochloris irregularis TaxID=706552 RepID=A0AAW1NLK1_9CHLO